MVVLEYDAFDFSRVFFMVQEQRDAHSPLQIVILSLQFTVEYFETNCFSNLKVSLLDGDASNVPVEIKLSPTASVDATNGPVERLVVAFLAVTQDALVTHMKSL